MTQRTWINVVSEVTGPARQAMYEFLVHTVETHGPQTAFEVAAYAGKRAGRCPWKRMGELVQLGVVLEHPARECAVTGKTALTYSPHPEYPRPAARVRNLAIPPTPTRAELAAFAEAVGRIGNIASHATGKKVLLWLRYRARAVIE